jgi:hypothetical protein
VRQPLSIALGGKKKARRARRASMLGRSAFSSNRVTAVPGLDPGIDPAIQAVFFDVSALLRPGSVDGDCAGMAGSSPAMTENVMTTYRRPL